MLELLRRGLTEEGHNVTCASDGGEGWELAHAYEFDAIVLDVMLPKMNGFELAKKLRQERIATPVLMLTAKDSVPDVVRGLDAGADDYLTKPFTFNELLARLMYRAGKVVPRNTLIESVWGFDREIEENTLDAFVRLLRHKVDREGMPKLILTVRGVGYMIREEPAA